MDNIARINRSLHKQFGGRFCVAPAKRHLSLQGESDDWHAIVQAGQLAAEMLRGEGSVVNDVRYTGEQPAATRLPLAQDKSLDGQAPDVLVIGGGLVGCAIARELARHNLDVVLLEKECDVAMHASSRNDGMVHPGLALKGKHTHSQRGNAMCKELCAELQVPFKRQGHCLCVRGTKRRWSRQGIRAKRLGRRKLRRRLPNLHVAHKRGVYFSATGAVFSHSLAVAYAENAIENGARVHLNTAVTDIEVRDGAIAAVHTNRGTLRPKLVVNAAGVWSEDIAKLAQDHFFSVYARRSTYALLDAKHSKLMRHSVSTPGGAGAIRTVHGNLLLCAGAVGTANNEDYTIHAQDLHSLFGSRSELSEAFHLEQGIAAFSGTHAATFDGNPVLRRGLYTTNIIHAAAVSLAAAPAVAQDVAQWAADTLQAAPNEDFNPQRQGIVHAAALNNLARSALIRREPDYGIILCRCAQISKGEILAAMRRPLPCDSLDGIKRRTRAGMGRCQGGFCCPQIAQVIAEERARRAMRSA
ncbi:MAG: FAD-dependent oxidoreductase [Oscillospiraceae bacterium]|nr:FAD-dependent oxidoreductase [Oscillospiraceae bacterium]